MINKRYSYLMDKTRKEVSEAMRQYENENDVWTFILQKKWWGKKTVLVLTFEDERVSRIQIKEIYGKIK